MAAGNSGPRNVPLVRSETMNSCITKCLLFVAVFVIGDVSLAQSYTMSSTQDAVHIEVHDARPLSAALQLISSAYPFEMTYEDPRNVYEGDREDVTQRVRADLHLYDDPSDAPRVLVPRTRSLTASISIRREAATRDDWLKAIEVVVGAQNTSGSGGRFRVEISASGAVHVIPIVGRDVNGVFVSQEPILDTLITIPSQQVNGLEMLSKLSEAISISAGGTFTYDISESLQSLLKPLRVPVGLLRRREVLLEAENQPAREVLLEALRSIDRTLTWQVFVTFDPTYENYWMNVRGLELQGRSEQAIFETILPKRTSGFLIPEEKREEFLRLREEGGP